MSQGTDQCHTNLGRLPTLRTYLKYIALQSFGRLVSLEEANFGRSSSLKQQSLLWTPSRTDKAKKATFEKSKPLYYCMHCIVCIGKTFCWSIIGRVLFELRNLSTVGAAQLGKKEHVMFVLSALSGSNPAHGPRNESQVGCIKNGSISVLSRRLLPYDLLHRDARFWLTYDLHFMQSRENWYFGLARQQAKLPMENLWKCSHMRAYLTFCTVAFQQSFFLILELCHCVVLDGYILGNRNKSYNFNFIFPFVLYFTVFPIYKIIQLRNMLYKYVRIHNFFYNIVIYLSKLLKNRFSNACFSFHA